MDRELIKRRLIEQQIYVKNLLRKKIVKRESFDIYSNYLNTKLVKAIIGPRRAGKTTLGLLLLENKDFYYVNFDDEVLATLKHEELGFLLEMLNELYGKRKYIFLDEIQNIGSWELFVNRLQRMDYNIIISGSNSKLLSRELGSHLGGRAFILEVLPFDFTEFLNALESPKFPRTDEGIGLKKKKIREYLSIGGFPEVVLNLNPDLIKEYHNELFNTIIFKDISQRYNIRYPSELVSLANVILNQFSSRTSLSKISKELGISVHTITKYISYLEDAYLILSSKKFSYKPREMESSFRKYYCIDTGLLNTKKKTLTVDFGKLLENMVALELKRKGADLYYYIVDNKYEVDFVVTENNKVTEVIQVVNDEKEVPEREVKTGILACNKLKCHLLTVVTWNKKGKSKEGNINIQMIPLWEYLIKKKKNS